MDGWMDARQHQTEQCVCVCVCVWQQQWSVSELLLCVWGSVVFVVVVIAHKDLWRHLLQSLCCVCVYSSLVQRKRRRWWLLGFASCCSVGIAIEILLYLRYKGLLAWCWFIKHLTARPPYASVIWRAKRSKMVPLTWGAMARAIFETGPPCASSSSSSSSFSLSSFPCARGSPSERVQEYHPTRPFNSVQARRCYLSRHNCPNCWMQLGKLQFSSYSKSSCNTNKLGAHRVSWFLITCCHTNVLFFFCFFLGRCCKPLGKGFKLGQAFPTFLKRPGCKLFVIKCVLLLCHCCGCMLFY